MNQFSANVPADELKPPQLDHKYLSDDNPNPHFMPNRLRLSLEGVSQQRHPLHEG
jgi:hypothetical protein